MIWLSFVDRTKPEGGQFLGVIMVDAKDIMEAVKLCHAMNINPGGEVMGFWFDDPAIPTCDQNVLLSAEQLMDRGHEGITKEEAKKVFDPTDVDRIFGD